jgi:hypothetical protein
VLRIIAFWCAVLAVFFCAWGWIGNSWAGGFDGPHRSEFVSRADLFFWLLCAALLVSMMLAWKWIRLVQEMPHGAVGTSEKRTVAMPPLQNLAALALSITIAASAHAQINQIAKQGQTARFDGSIKKDPIPLIAAPHA